MIHVDWTKLVVAVIVVGGVIVLMGLGKVDSAAGLGLIGTVVGYILGNGSSVVAGERPGTLLTRDDVRSRAGDPDTR